MTSRSCWKGSEKRAAKFFGSTRTPLSGGNSKHTRSDSLSPDFFVEAKLRAHSATHALYRETEKLAKREGKIPVLALFEKHAKGFLIVVSDGNFARLARKFIYTVRLPRRQGHVTPPHPPLRAP